MRTILAVLMCLAWCRIAYAQQAIAPHPYPTLEGTIERLLFHGFIEGQGDKQMKRAGDGAAVALARAIGDRDLTATEIDESVYVLDVAFSDPSWIEDASNREPRTSLFVLRYLDLCTQDQGLKGKIAETRRRLKELMVKTSGPGH